MKFKLHRIAVFIFSTRGTCYQVALQKREAECVSTLISQLHNGCPKVMANKMPMVMPKYPKTKSEALVQRGAVETILKG